MADPVTLAAISIGTTVLSSGVSAYSSYESGQASSSMYSYQSAVAQMNAQIQNQNADYAVKSGEVQAQESGMKTAAEIGQTKATQGAAGLDVTSGSAKEVRASEVSIGAENMALTRSNAARTAYGYKVTAAQEEAQSTLYDKAASQSKTSGTIGAISSILGGASSVSSKWSQASSSGVFGTTKSDSSAYSTMGA